MKPAIKPDRTSRAYFEGRSAFSKDKECPYASGTKSQQRLDWMTGYYDVRTERATRQIVTKLGLNPYAVG